MQPMNRILSCVISDCSEPVRIDLYLAKRFSYNNRELWKAEILNGKVFLNDSAIFNTHKIIKNGDKIEYFGSRKEEPEVDRNFKTIFEDENIIVINKTGNLPVHASGIFFNNTLQTILENDRGVKYHPIHRLDRETSGVILFTKNAAYAALYHEALKTAQKVYVAIVHGIMADDYLDIDMPIGSEHGGMSDSDCGDTIVRKKRKAFPGAEESAFTRIVKIKTFDSYTIVKALPKTGRLHQIRVHLNYAGLPIVGDKIYGKDEKFYLAFIRDGLTEDLLSELEMKRCALHAHKLKIINPDTGEFVKYIAPYPDDFKEFCENRNALLTTVR